MFFIEAIYLDDDKELREKILNSLKLQGFNINSSLEPIDNEKCTLKKIHLIKRREQLLLHKKFLSDNFCTVREHVVSGKNLEPAKIQLNLIEVKPNSYYSKLFFWWNLFWWSIPYDKPIGRLMNFILWDEYHQAPFGLFSLQSPQLRSSIRDNFLDLNSENSNYWINQSLHGQRIGALPPYNDLLGGKMVALAMVSNEVRKLYESKYENKKTILKKRYLPNRLLFITTTSAYGKSSVYERINYGGKKVGQFIGYTSGAGTFHLSEDLYMECLKYLERNGVNIKRGYGTGTSRKLRLNIEMALRNLKIRKCTYHNIKRGYYLFENTENLNEVIHEGQEPIWFNRPFNEIRQFWLNRWCIPRSRRHYLDFQ